MFAKKISWYLLPVGFLVLPFFHISFLNTMEMPPNHNSHYLKKPSDKPSLQKTTRSKQHTIHQAAHRGDIANVQLFLKNGVDINSVEKERGQTALHMAAFKGHNELIEFLLQRGALIGITDKEGKTPLHLAASIVSTVLIIITKLLYILLLF
jgi:ankyrin repeat protein